MAAGYLAAGGVDLAIDVGRRALRATLETETAMGTTRLKALALKPPEEHRAAQELRKEIKAAPG